MLLSFLATARCPELWADSEAALGKSLAAISYQWRGLEARVRIELTRKGFADLSLTTWVPRRLAERMWWRCGQLVTPTR
jgi:hypothetical protein